jgi:hypothetical protein
MGSEIQWDVVLEYCTRLPAAIITFTSVMKGKREGPKNTALNI